MASAGVVNSRTHSAAASMPFWAIRLSAASPIGCGSITIGRAGWPSPHATIWPSGQNERLTSATVGTPAFSRLTASMTLQGDEEPQWPTPLMATSVSAAISSMNGAPLAGKPLRQNLICVAPKSRRSTAASPSSTTSENSFPLSRRPIRNPLRDCGRSAGRIAAVAGTPVGTSTVAVDDMLTSCCRTGYTSVYRLIQSPRSPDTPPRGIGHAAAARRPPPRWRGRPPIRIERSNRLQPLRRRPVIGRIEAQARAVLEFDIELGRGQRHFRIAFGDVHLPLEHAAIAQVKFHVHWPAAHLPAALDAFMHVHGNAARERLRRRVLHKAISACIEADIVIENRARDRIRHRELRLEPGVRNEIAKLVVGIARHAGLTGDDFVRLEMVLVLKGVDRIDRGMQGDAARIRLDDHAAHNELVVLAEFLERRHIGGETARI